MPPSLPDDSVFEEEEGVRTDVSIAINLALNDVLDHSDERELTDVEEEKLTHFAIRDCDLPLTFSWYLAGAHTIPERNPDDRSPWQPGQAFGGIQAQDPQYNYRVQELRDYFRSTEFIPGYTLRDVWYTDKFEFLRDYYRELAPEKYRDLYIHSLELRESLWNLNELLNTESKNRSLGDFGAGVPDTLLEPSREEEIRYLVSGYQLDLARIDELSPIKQEVTRGTDLIERILSKLTQKESTTPEQRRLIEDDLHDLFYYYLWKYPALAISVDTATGPNANALRQKRLVEFNEFDQRLITEVDDVTRRARELDLLPGVEEPISEGTEKSRYLHELIKQTVDPRDE
jgi:hypothetical protein